MSDKKQSFMQQLDGWTTEVVIAPLLDNGPEAIERVQRAIREKVLESYRNGQAAGPRTARKDQRDHAKAQTR